MYNIQAKKNNVLINFTTLKKKKNSMTLSTDHFKKTLNNVFHSFLIPLERSLPKLINNIRDLPSTSDFLVSHQNSSFNFSEMNMATSISIRCCIGNSSQL